MARLKLDLHAIYNDGTRIEAALEAILGEAEQKRIEEVEIIPGKGSGALKKTVLRFLDRPEIRRRYHRVVKDGDNWGRLFVYFRFGERTTGKLTGDGSRSAPETGEYHCFCCGAANRVSLSDPDDERAGAPGPVECPACGSPNRLVIRNMGPRRVIEAHSGY